MAYGVAMDLPRPVEHDLESRAERPSRGPIATRIDCLHQLLRAFSDIADRDDIHQVALRLASVQEWIRSEAARAAEDPIFGDATSSNGQPALGMPGALWILAAARYADSEACQATRGSCRAS